MYKVGYSLQNTQQLYLKRSFCVSHQFIFYLFHKMLRTLRRLSSSSPLSRFLTTSRPIYFKSYLLKGGRVVNSDHSQPADVLISDGRIKQVGSLSPSQPNTQTIDCSNKLIIPGGIDTHTHMQLPFMGTEAKDDFHLGSKAAVIGGTTSFIDFVIADKGESLDSAYKRWRDKADGKVACDYALHCAITEWNDNTPQQMKSMVDCGITSFKFFMAYNKVLRVDDITLYKAFEVARDLGALCLVHAENGDLIEINQEKMIKLGITGPEGHYLSRPESIEADAVHRVLTIAQHANCPVYIVHLMSKSSSDQVLRAKLKGNQVFSQTLAASIGIDGKKLWDQNWDVASRYVMSPPINPDPTTKTYLMQMLHNHVIDVVGTDNCTFCTQQKRMGKNDFRKIPNGVNGIEDRMAVVWTKGVRSGLLSENEFVRVTSTQAAKLFNMYPRKGVIRKGADADVVVWNPKEKKVITNDNHHQNIDYNIFDGMEVHGRADYTFSGGQLVWDGSKFNEKVKGKYVSRKPFGHAYARHKYWTLHNDPLKHKVNRSGSGNQSNKSTKEEELQKQINKLQSENRQLSKENARLKALSEDKRTQSNQYGADGEFKGVDGALKTYLPLKVYQSVKQILYGSQCQEPQIHKETLAYANKLDFQIKNFKFPALKQQLRTKRTVKIAAIQNKIHKPTTDPVKVQKQAIIDRVCEMIKAAALQKANVVCMQQIWNAPFFMCTRERYPWIEFAEPVNGESTKIMAQLAKKHNMVIISSILERCEVRGTLHNSAVVIDNYGEILGKQIKGHIPRVGDFNESTYYMEGDSGHPVFETDFGKLAINICYGRHHPLNWMAFGLNGAEIVFNPSATIGGLSEPLWGIQARNAAIANHYFAVGINRIGTEVYPNAFTSGDGKPAHKNFGHFYGSTYVAAPDGSRTPSLSRDREGLLLTTVDLNACQQVKDKWGFTMTARYSDYAEFLAKFCKPGYVPHVIKGKKRESL